MSGRAVCVCVIGCVYMREVLDASMCISERGVCMCVHKRRGTVYMRGSCD